MCSMVTVVNDTVLHISMLPRNLRSPYQKEEFFLEKKIYGNEIWKLISFRSSPNNCHIQARQNTIALPEAI